MCRVAYAVWFEVAGAVAAESATRLQPCSIYELKESFRDVWTAASLAESEERYEAWQKRVTDSEVVGAYQPLLSAMKNWREEIFAYMTWRLTNAYTESFNAMARRMDPMGRGYSFKVLRAKLLMMHTAHKHAPAAKFVRNFHIEQPSAAASNTMSLGRLPPKEYRPSTSDLQTDIGRMPWLGCDLSTLAAEMQRMPDTE